MSDTEVDTTTEANFPDCAGKTDSESVPLVYKWATINVNQHIRWYRDGQDGFKNKAKGIRFFSLIALGLGGITPLLGALPFVSKNLPDLGQCGYVALAVAGVLLMIDNYCGYSRTWIRHVNTWLSLDKLRDEFHFDWVNLVTAATPDYSVQLKRLQDYVLAADEIVKNETAQWATDFQNSMTQLDAAVKTATAAAKPGSMNIKVAGTTGLKNIKVTVGGSQKSLDGASETLFNQMPPNNYLVEVTGEDSNGNTIRQTAPVAVQAATMSSATISLAQP